MPAPCRLFCLDYANFHALASADKRSANMFLFSATVILESIWLCMIRAGRTARETGLDREKKPVGRSSFGS